MDTSPVPPTTTSPAPQNTSAGASSTATLSADFDVFLQMLTAQAKYQDPLEPVSSSDYAAQLAQFSMVEQQVFTNEQLGELASAIGGSGISTLAGWVGMDIRAPTSAQFDGTPLTLIPSPAASADQTQLVIYNDFGAEVGRREIPVSAAPYPWDGRDQRGQTLPSGPYSFVLESYQGGQFVSSTPVEVYARVTEAQLVDGAAVLKLDSGATVSPDDVTALRESGI